MSWIAALAKGLMEAILPWVFKKEKTVARDSDPVDASLRGGWAARINRRLSEYESKSRDDPSDHIR